jgi:hypothetical protein
MKDWTEHERKLLKELFPKIRTKTIAEMLNRTYASVSTQANLLGLHKSEAFLKTINSGRIWKGSNKGIDMRFKKGHVPVNKGKKWDQYMSEEAKQGSRKTTFKEGHTPHNTKKDNQITWRNDEGRAYQYIRISKAKWLPLHVFNWEKVNGKVPKGMNIVFKTKSTENCEIDNLEMITNAENMRRNSLHRYPKEVSHAIQTLAALNRQIKKRNE